MATPLEQSKANYDGAVRTYYNVVALFGEDSPQAADAYGNLQVAYQTNQDMIAYYAAQETVPPSNASTAPTGSGLSAIADESTFSANQRAAFNILKAIGGMGVFDLLGKLNSPAYKGTIYDIGAKLLTIQNKYNLTNQELIDYTTRTTNIPASEVEKILNNKNNYQLLEDSQNGGYTYIPNSAAAEFIAANKQYANLLANAPYGRNPITGMPYTKEEAVKNTQIDALKSGFLYTTTNNPATSTNVKQNPANAFRFVLDKIESGALSLSEASSALGMTIEQLAGHARYYLGVNDARINKIFGTNEYGVPYGVGSEGGVNSIRAYPTSTAPTSTAPTSTAPTSTAPTSTAPTSTAPTTTGPTTTGPTTTGPTTTGPTTTGPTTTGPTTTGPTTTGPTTTGPTTTGPTTTGPTTTGPTTTGPTTTGPTTTGPTTTGPTTAPPNLPIIVRPPGETTPTTQTAFQPFYRGPTILQPTRGMTALLSTPNVTPDQDFRGYNPQSLINTTQELIYQDIANKGNNPKLTPTGLPSYLQSEFKLTPQETNYIVQSLKFGARPADIVPPSLTYPNSGFIAPSQGGLAFALGEGKANYPGGASDYYRAIGNYLTSPASDLSPQGVAQAMLKSGVTTDDLIKGKAAADAALINPVTSATGGLIKKYEKGGEIATETIGTVPDYVIKNILKEKLPATFETIADVATSPITNRLKEKLPATFETIADVATSPITNRPLTYKSNTIGSSEPSLKEAMKKYTLEDFGITQPKTNVFSYETQKMYTPLKGIEAIAYANMTPEQKAASLKELRIRQGRTGAEYFSDGGDVGRGLGSIAMKGYAEELRRQGRNGDTMLAHINPQEAQMLEMMGGSGTINPATGLPEYGFSWKKLLKAAQFVLPFIPGIGVPAKIALSALAGGFSGPKKGFDFRRGLISGATAYLGGKIGEGLQAAGQAGTSAATSTAADLASTTAQKLTDPTLMAGNIGTGAPFIGGTPVTELTSGYTPTVNLSEFSRVGPPPVELASTVPSAPIDVASDSVMQGAAPGPSFGSRVLDGGQNMYRGVENLISGVPGSSEAFKTAAGMAPTTALAASAIAPGVMSSYDEALQQKLAFAKTAEERRKIIEEFDQLFSRTLGSFGYAAGGMTGLSALAAGGATGPANQPRTINGVGDGMSDSVPATIEGIQEARLADGEFVIPADVVADLGNGSSNAGSKKLYAMMDRIRQSRHGTTRQPPEINMNRFMPA